MKAALITFAVMVFTTILMAQNRAAQTPPIKESGFRVSLVGGNELYAWCSTAQRTVNVQVDGVRFTGSPEDQHAAALCWGYVEGIVDMSPVGEEFNPGEGVRSSQYVDVITNYLKSHPNIRNQSAAELVQNALREAFPKTAPR